MKNKKSKLKILVRISLISLITLLVLSPTIGCKDEGTVRIKATLNGQIWEGPIEYNFGAKEFTGCGAALSGNEGSVPARYSCYPQDYIAKYISGGPEGAQFSGIGYVSYDIGDIPELDVMSSSRYQFEVKEGAMSAIYFVFITVGEITVNATLDGDPWSGPVDYTIEGPGTESGSTTPQSFAEVPVGTYTATYNSGGPPGAILSSISPSATKELTAVGTTTFILAFETEEKTGEITVDATLDGQPWEGSVSYTIQGPATEQGTSVGQTFSELPIGTYTATYNSGGPEGAIFSGVSPSATEELPTVGTTAFTLEFVTAEEKTGEITVNAIVQGIPWSGKVSYTIQGPRTESGSSTPQSFSGLPAGTYTVTYKSGHPKFAIFSYVNPSNPQELSAGETATFILVFIYPSYGGTPTTVPSADLSLTKTVNNATPNQGDNITYTITVTNNGPDDATNIVVTDNLPAGVTYVNDNPSQGAYNNATGLWTVGTIANGGNATLQITATVTAAAAATVTNTAELTSVDQTDPDSTPNNNILAEDDQDTAAFTVQSANLSVTKTVDNATPIQGNNVTYTVTVTNNGPDAATGIVVTDTLPAGVTYVDYNKSQGLYDNVTGIWTVGTIAAGGNATLQITATVTFAAGATITNTAELTAVDQADPDSTPDNDILAEDDQDTAAFTVQNAADLRLTKTVDYPLRPPGEDIQYTITVTNDGPDAATNIVVTDNLPAGVTYVNGNPSQGAYDNVTGIWTVGTIANNGNATLWITVTVDGDAVPGTDITNTAQVTSVDQADPDSTPNNDILAEDDQDNAVTTVEGV